MGEHVGSAWRGENTYSYLSIVYATMGALLRKSDSVVLGLGRPGRLFSLKDMARAQKGEERLLLAAKSQEPSRS